MLLFIEEFPEIQEIIEERLKTFIEQPETRTKKQTPQLGIYLAMTLFSQKYTMRDLLEPYFSE